MRTVKDTGARYARYEKGAILKNVAFLTLWLALRRVLYAKKNMRVSWGNSALSER